MGRAGVSCAARARVCVCVCVCVCVWDKLLLPILPPSSTTLLTQGLFGCGVLCV